FIQHGLVVHSQSLSAVDNEQLVKPCAGDSGENNAFHYVHSFVQDKGCAAPGLRAAMPAPARSQSGGCVRCQQCKRPAPSQTLRRTGLLLFYTAVGEKSTGWAIPLRHSPLARPPVCPLRPCGPPPLALRTPNKPEKRSKRQQG